MSFVIPISVCFHQISYFLAMLPILLVKLNVSKSVDILLIIYFTQQLIHQYRLNFINAKAVQNYNLIIFLLILFSLCLSNPCLQLLVLQYHDDVRLLFLNLLYIQIICCEEFFLYFIFLKVLLISRAAHVIFLN